MGGHTDVSFCRKEPLEETLGEQPRSRAVSALGVLGASPAPARSRLPLHAPRQAQHQVLPRKLQASSQGSERVHGLPTVTQQVSSGPAFAPRCPTWECLPPGAGASALPRTAERGGDLRRLLFTIKVSQTWGCAFSLLGGDSSRRMGSQDIPSLLKRLNPPLPEAKDAPHPGSCSGSKAKTPVCIQTALSRSESPLASRGFVQLWGAGGCSVTGEDPGFCSGPGCMWEGARALTGVVLPEATC